MKILIRLHVIGYNLDQLINKIYSLNIVCYNISKIDKNKIKFSIHYKDFKKVKPLLKSYEYNINYLGLANFKNWFLKNLAIILIIPIALGAIIFSTKYIWDIKIYGGDSELNSSVFNILKENNVEVGKRISITSDDIEDILINQLPNIAQVSCIKRGTTFIINISKKLVYTPESFEPIRARFDGVVTDFSLISGTMAVSVGDFVKQGDILVYPFIADKNGVQTSVNPIAEVNATAYVVGSSQLAASTVVLARTGKQYTTSSIMFLNKNLFSKKSIKPFALYETSVYNENISSVLPIVKSKITYYELDYIVVENDLAENREKVEQESEMNAYNNLPENSKILDKQTTSIIVQDCLYSTTTLTISTIIS